MSLTALRDHLRDERVWCVAARVALHDGDSSHFDTAKNGQLIISVRTLRHDVPIWAMMKGGDVDGKGMWKIPAIGTEVMVGFDDGMFEGDAYIMGFAGKPPTGLAEDETVIADDTVKLGSVNASAAVVVQTALDLFLQALNNSVNSTALAPGLMAPGKTALTVLYAALSTGICLPAPPILELAEGWSAGTTRTKAD